MNHFQRVSHSDDDKDEDDEWGTQELVIDRITTATAVSIQGLNYKDYGNNDEYWNEHEDKRVSCKETNGMTKNEDSSTLSSLKGTTVNHAASSDPDNPAAGCGEPMFLLDITQINPLIHSKFDRNSVNDHMAASKIRKQFERDFHTLSKDASLLASGTVIPCSTTVWKQALSKMREERKGHYFVPIFNT